jgi:hypothetical protein
MVLAVDTSGCPLRTAGDAHSLLAIALNETPPPLGILSPGLW